MPEELSPGSKVRTMDGTVVTVRKLLGQGGQGRVYLVDWNGKDAALKWYKPESLGRNPAQFYANIEKNVLMGAPDPVFLWPLAITEWQDGTFGYVMDLRPEGYYELSSFILPVEEGRVSFSSYKAIIDAALKTVTAFRLLHSRGYSYLDLNDGNLFINPQTGDVRICDNDNAAPVNTYIGVLGKPRYMAPEVVTGASNPNIRSDQFSMAVLLYRMFCLDHPLEGKRYLIPLLTDMHEKALYGTEPIFIMDPDDHRNGPKASVHNSVKLWPALPDYMQAIFLRAFGQKGLHNPNARPTEYDWIIALTRFRSEIVTCQWCGAVVFTHDGKPCACGRCGKMLPINYQLELQNAQYRIPAVKGSRVYRCQMQVCDADVALDPVAVVALRTSTNQLRLKNVSGKRWNAVTPSGEAVHVAAGESIPLAGGSRFSVFNGTVAVRKIKTK